MGRRPKQSAENQILPSNEQQERADGVKRSIGAVVAFVLAALFVLGFFDLAGPLGRGFDMGIGWLFGWGKWIAPFVSLMIGIFLLGRKPEQWSDVLRFAGLGIAFAGLLGLFHLIAGDADTLPELAQSGGGGGLLGFGLAMAATSVAGNIGGILLLFTLFCIGCIAAFNVSLLHWVEKWRLWRAEGEIGNSEENQEDVDEILDLDDEGLSSEESPREVGQERFDVIKKEERRDYTEDGLSLWENEETSGGGIVGNMTHIDDQELKQANIGSIRFGETHATPGQSDNPAIGEVSETYPLESNSEQTMVDGSSEEGDEILSQRRKPRRRIIHWKLPPHNLVERHAAPTERIDGKDQNARIIQETLKHFGIEVELGSVQNGPTVTQYTFRPATGVKLSRITTLNNDLALALAAPSIRIEAPIPGKALVGIEVPNSDQASVRFRNLLESREVSGRKEESLLMILGKGVSGDAIAVNLEKMPHLLIAGATNSGKSVCINTLILSLLYRNTPEDLQLILVDPKRVELTPYNKIPHLKTDVIVEPKKVVNVLRWAVNEMERRYKILEESQSRDIHSYRSKRQAGGTYSSLDPATNKQTIHELDAMPFIVIVIDEMADLMMAHGKDVESLIVRLAQMSRAVGIHLILATQRPSVEVITGLIKANIIARIAFQVATQIDSRTILDMSGAEKLLGRGDMLFLSPTAPQPRRIQGVFVSEEEVRRVTDFWRTQARDFEEDIPESFGTEKTYESGVVDTHQSATDPFASDTFDTETPDLDERYEEAKRIVIETGKASASLLQRRMSVGYSRAARILDELEAGGIVGPADGAKPRAVFVGKGAKNQDMVGYEDAAEDQKTRENWTV